tara:strand:+ start:1365 stop:2246 length:882 start_codon:yes stop_codon:yes gene_type:complete
VKLERQLRVLLTMLVALQAMTAVAGIGLLERMTPAIGEILAENVRSVAAVETMLARLAEPPTDHHRATFAEALAVAQGNVTEEVERAELATIEATWEAGFDGDPEAHEQTVRALLRLGEINREAMAGADADARRLGSAGRWALAFLAILGFIVSFVAVGRARHRVLEPLADLLATARASRKGDVHRRCTLEQGLEITEVAETLNELLDDRQRRQPTIQGILRQEALPTLLDLSPEPVVLIDAAGTVVAANAPALDVLGERGDEVLGRIRRAEPPLGEVLPGSELRLVPLAAAG